MDLVLHLGAHRTGTTTLQNYMRSQQGALSKDGIAVWTPKRTRNGLFAGLSRADDSQDIRAAWSHGLVKVEFERLSRAGHHRLVISEENILGSIRENLRLGGLYPNIKPRLSRFAPVMQGHTTKIALTIRSQDAYWASALAFAVRACLPIPGEAELQDLTQSERGWQHVIRDIAEMFPDADIIVWPAERFISQPEIALSFMTGSDVIKSGGTARHWHNKSPDAESLRKLVADQAGTDKVPDNLTGSGRWMPFDPHQQNHLKSRYRADLAWLRSGADGLARFIEQTRPSAEGDPHIST